MTLDAHVWWGGYAIDISGATYDPMLRKLFVTAAFLNTSTASTNVSALGREMNVVWNGTYLQGFMPNGAVPAGGTVKGEIQFGPPAGFTPETAFLTFGQPTEHQATVPLNGDAATSEQPIEFPVSGTVKIGKYVRYAVTSGILIPASCAGSPTQMSHGPMKAGEMSIVLSGVATNSESSGSAFIDKAYLNVPDGTTSAAIPAMYVSVTGKGAVRDARMCFMVPAPASGAYELTMHELRAKKNGAITFQVP
jgi:hypothetical protein